MVPRVELKPVEQKEYLHKTTWSDHGLAKKFRYEDDNYVIYFEIGIDPRTGELNPEIEGHLFRAKRAGVMGAYAGTGIRRTTALPRPGIDIAEWGIGPTALNCVDEYFINETSDPAYWEAKQVLMQLDAWVREKFPGFGVLYRDGDYEGPEAAHAAHESKMQTRDVFRAKLDATRQAYWAARNPEHS